MKTSEVQNSFYEALKEFQETSKSYRDNKLNLVVIKARKITWPAESNQKKHD